MIEAIAEADDEVDARLPRGRAPIVAGAAARGAPPGDRRRPRGAGAAAARRSRTRACSRCSTRWSTTCRRRSTSRRSSARTPDGQRTARRPSDDGAVLGAGVQDHERPVRRDADLLPGLLGQGRGGRDGLQRRQGEARAHRAPPADARQQARGHQRGHLRQHRGGRRPARHHHRRHAVRREGAGRAGGDGVPGAGHLDRHRAEDAGQPGQAGPGAGRSWPIEDPSFRVQDRRRDRADASSRGWASCTWRSSSTGWCASSRSRPTSAGRRSPTARPSRARPKPRGSTSGRPAGAASTGTSRCTSSRPRARGSSSRTRPSGGAVPREFVPAVERGVRESLARGVLAGYPMIDVAGHADRRQLPRARLERDGLPDCRLDGRQAAAREAAPVLLEPVMEVEVLTPDEFMGEVTGNLSARRGPGLGDGGARLGSGDQRRGSAGDACSAIPLTSDR